MVTRGPKLRAQPSPQLFDALHEQYGIAVGEGGKAKDLGGSSNLTLLIPNASVTGTPVTGVSNGADGLAHGQAHGRADYVVRVYRPWVTVGRLEDMQLVRRVLASGGVPCAEPILTANGESWIMVDDRLVEVEPYCEHNAKMDSWQRLGEGLPLLGRIHTLLRPLRVSEQGRNAPASNNIEPQEVLPGVLHGVHRIRQWVDASPLELQLADASEKLAHLVDREQRDLGVEGLARQLVHGDYWDNNVLFGDGRVVLVTDFDFMGERARIDDLALTLYYTNSTFSDDTTSDNRLKRLGTLVDAYDAGLDKRLSLTELERLAIPLALARAPLAFIAMIPFVDSETGARQLAAEMNPDVRWALDVIQDLERWQSAFAQD